MATSTRRRGPARWILIGLSGLASAGFLGAILNNAPPADTSPQAPAAETQAPIEHTQAIVPAQSVSSSAPQTISSSLPQQSFQTSSVPVSRPRLRTRGS
jgi:hypothetical protein